MSAAVRPPDRPWAAAHRSLLLLTALVVVIVAAGITIPLTLYRGGTAAPAPARPQAPTVQQTPVSPSPFPCYLSSIEQPQPC